MLLGAGLDTFAYRNPHPALRVFEVDHPATQAWKRTLLARAAISEPESLTFVPVDFERQTVMNELLAAGFDRSAPALFAWLGVTMYLSEAAVYSVLEAIAGLPPPSGVVFDYAVAGSELNLVTRMVVAIVNRRLTREGEPWVTFFTPRALAAALKTLGFHRVRDWGPEELNATYFSGRTDGLQVSAAARVVAASV